MSHRPPLRLASVGYLNARPLIHGLDAQGDLALSLHVPSDLLGRLQSHAADVALLPVIDYQRMPGLRVMPVGGIGCDGPTLTVRLFARAPIGQTRVLAVDPDSHTSVALARVLLKRIHNLTPRVVDRSHATDEPHTTLLLIGDKVVCDEPAGYPHQLDLGKAWNDHTGLPFVFAVWMARDGVDLRDLPARLTHAREQGMAHIDPIVETYGLPRGWPRDLARQYLTQYLKFEIGPRQLDAIRLFHQWAFDDGLIDACRPLITI